MWYEINVSRFRKCADGKKRYVHFFATHTRSLTTEQDAREALEIFREKLPAPYYKVDIKRCEQTAEYLDW
jgi:hypothetical protein